MNAILVSVNYSDVLRMTLPYNRHHFQKVLVVTDLDGFTELYDICDPLNVEVFATNAFYDNGAAFNKWKALEQGLDKLGREGWICIMDADVFWPKDLSSPFLDGVATVTARMREQYETIKWHAPTGGTMYQDRGMLATPLRRMCPDLPKQIPHEATWKQYPVHRNISEWAGYSQIFHASDPCLKLCANCNLPLEDHMDRDVLSTTCRAKGQDFSWHQTNWRHAGGADSFFQLRWQHIKKIRPPFEVLHVGGSGSNWCGRTSRMMDGTLPPNYTKHQQELQRLIESRRRNRANYNNPVEKNL
jgi:hypothetical protein